MKILRRRIRPSMQDYSYAINTTRNNNNRNFNLHTSAHTLHFSDDFLAVRFMHGFVREFIVGFFLQFFFFLIFRTQPMFLPPTVT